MAWSPISLTGGVVKTKDAQVLESGELASSTGWRLRPNDLVQVHRDRGRALFNAVPLVSTGFLRFLSFEAGGNSLLAGVNDGLNGRLFTAPAGLSGAFTLLYNFGVGLIEALTAVHRGDEYFVGTSLGNRVVSAAGTSRVLGLVGTPLATIYLLSGFASALAVWTAGDVVAYWWVEYDSVHDVESKIKWHIGGVSLTTDGDYWRVETPWSGVGIAQGYVREASNPDKVRLYRHYCGNVTSNNIANELAYAIRTGASPATGGLVVEMDWDDAAYPSRYDDIASSRFDPASQYPLLTVEANGGFLFYERNRQPERFDVGAVFNDSLVVNAPGTSKQIIRWSPPGFPEYQPVPYFMYFATEKSDEIVGLRVVNDRLIVLLTGGIFRVNYLPFEGDLEIARGRVQDRICEQGAVGREASTTVETESGEVVVWLSRQGLRATDGVRWVDACPDFSVEGAGLNPSTLSQSVLLRNPREHRLELYTAEGQRWDFNYHPSHVKRGGFKMMGPTLMEPVRSGAAGWSGGDDVVWTLDTARNVYTEGQGEFSGSPTLSTGFIQSGHPFNRVDLEQVGLTHDSSDSTISVSIAAKDIGGVVNVTTVTIQDNAKRESGAEFVAASGNYVQLSLTASGGSQGGEAWGPLWVRMSEQQGGR